MSHFGRNLVLRNVVEVAAGFGVTEARLMRHLQNVVAGNALRPGAFVPTGLIVDGVETGALLTGRHDFGILVGKRADYRTYGAFGATIGETSEARFIIAEAFRFAMTLNSGVDLLLVDAGQFTEARFQVTAPSTFAPHHYAECQIYVVHHFMQLLFGPDWSPVRVQFRHERLGTMRSYETVFGCEVAFGQGTAGVILKPEDMDRSLTAVDTPIGAMVQQMLEEATSSQERTTVSAVGSLLPPLLSSGKATIEHIAPLLGVSERTLQRRLRDEGSSLRQIIHGERLKIISRVMASGVPPGEALRKLLGFSDASAASRFLREHSPAPALRSADGTGGEPE